MPDNKQDRSLTLLYQRHRNELLAFLTRRVRCRETARDLLQDAFVRLMHSERGDVGNLRAFLYRIANNLSIDHARRNQVRGVNDEQALEQLLTDTGPERSAVAANKPKMIITMTNSIKVKPCCCLEIVRIRSSPGLKSIVYSFDYTN